VAGSIVYILHTFDELALALTFFTSRFPIASEVFEVMQAPGTESVEREREREK
jgi:hypothetical protein